jgi:hypothetical protein
MMPQGTKRDREVRSVASFLLAFSTQRRRLRESATAAQASLRNERRALEDLEKSLSERQPQTP